jgi:hypothetical protein
MSSQSYIFNPTERTLAAAGDGFSAPRLTTTDRLALSLGVNGKGMMVYDTTLLTLYLWNGTAWVSFPASGYSQGIWSPAFLPVTGSITLVPASSTGLWRRIGNTVTVVGHFAVRSVSSPTGLLTIDNLPFAPVVGFEGAAAITGFGFSAGAITSIVATISGSSIQAYHYQAGALNALSVHVIAGTNLYISGTYITT